MKQLDYGQTITVLANVGVIAGIIFLAIEVHQNTEMQQLTAAQQVLGLSYQTSMMLASDRSLSESLELAAAGEDLEPGQRGQINAFIRGTFRAAWQVFVLRQQDYIEDDIFYSYERGIPGLFSQPFADEHWQANRDLYPEKFRSWIEDHR